MALYDFRLGNNRWGHALHSDLTRFLEPRTKGWWRWKKVVAQRCSHVVHCSPFPQVGDKVMWTTATREITATIYAVEPFWNPRDMHTLFVEYDEVS